MKNELKVNFTPIKLTAQEINIIGTTNYQTLSNNEVNLERKLFTMMNLLGIPSHLSGYKYIKDAITICIDNNYEVPTVSKNLYPEIAAKYEKKDSQVERSIREAINKCIDRADSEILFLIFGYTIDSEKARPTNKAFIAQLVNFWKIICK